MQEPREPPHPGRTVAVKNSLATYGHKSLTLNAHLPGNPPVFDRTLAQSHIGVDRLVIRPQYRDLKEPLHLAQGGTAGRVHKGMLSMQAQGRILVPNATQAASMEDQEKALRLAFDPFECYRDSPSTDGVYALSWLEPTLDTTNYATGWMPVTRYVRPVAQPETEWSMTDQSYRQWSANLVAPDPRLYDSTLGAAENAVGGTVVPLTITNKGSITGPLKVSLTMSGGGDNDFTITRTTGVPLTNYDFESGTLAGWDLQLTGTGAVVIYSGQHYNGSYSAQMAAGSSGMARIIGTDSVPAGSAEVISVGLWAFGSSNPTVRYGVAFYGSAMNYLSSTDLGSAPLAASWTHLTGTVITPVYTAYIRAIVTTTTAGGAWVAVDNVSMSRGPNTVFGLDLSGCANNDAIDVVMETCGPFGAGKSVKKNGVTNFALKNTGPTSWLDVPVGTSTFTPARLTGVYRLGYQWGHAWP
jgi:hypothetical protein